MTTKRKVLLGVVIGGSVLDLAAHFPAELRAQRGPSGNASTAETLAALWNTFAGFLELAFSPLGIIILLAIAGAFILTKSNPPKT